MGFEGVVCKGIQRDKDKKEIIRFKVKNRKWIEALKDQCNGDMELFNKLV